MSDPITLFKRAGENFLERLKSVQADEWDKESINPGWDVRKLVNHIVGVLLAGPEIFAGGQMGSRDDIDVLGDDPLTAAEKAYKDAVEAYSQPGMMEKKFPSKMMGERSGADYALFFAADIAVHTWDLAKSIGAEAEMDGELVEIAWVNFEPMADLGRQMGVFGPKVEVPKEAPKQERLLGVTGRDPK